MIFPFEGIEVDGLGFRAQCQLLLPPTDAWKNQKVGL